MSLRRVVRLAEAHLRRRRALARLAAVQIRRLWAQVDRANIAGSWRALLPRAEALVIVAQATATAQSAGYLAALAAAYGLPDLPGGSLRTSSLVGVASDGRPLDSLLYQPAIKALQTIAGGRTTVQGMGVGAFTADLIADTQVSDAGRVGDGVELVARPEFTGYVRQLVLPSCSRCILLAGQFYRWNSGFLRHPGCDCVHIPATEDVADDVTTDPQVAFDSMTAEAQDKVFTISGAQAIRDGADIGQVVNARRGMKTAGTSATRVNAEGRVVNVTRKTRVPAPTVEGTRRGAAIRRLGGGPRLMPEQIYRIADGNRDEALRLLRRHGYIV